MSRTLFVGNALSVPSPQRPSPFAVVDCGLAGPHRCDVCPALEPQTVSAALSYRGVIPWHGF